MSQKHQTAKQKRPPYFKKYNSWRIRILYSIIIGYATFYFCRQNFNIAMPSLMDHFSASKTQLGWVLTAGSIVYGIGKFCNGFISDKSNSRLFMVLGLASVGFITLLSGFSTTITFLGILWICNNWFQSMGWPPATRMLTHWYAAKELGMKWSLGTTANQIGGAVAMVTCGYLVDIYGWQYAFFLPGTVALLISIFLFNRLRNSPAEVGLPTVEEYKECDIVSQSTYEKLLTTQLFKLVLFNKLIWYVCLANMFIYVVRSGVVFWGPIFLRDCKAMSLSQAGWQVAAYDILGLIGAIVAGWMSDKIFHGRRGPVGTIFMLILFCTIIAFWKLPPEYKFLSIAIFSITGFFVAGPHMLIGVATADFTSKQAVGTANGFSGLFGYLGSSLAGVCVGSIIDNWGWSGVFLFFSLSALLGAFFFALTWSYSARKRHSPSTIL